MSCFMIVSGEQIDMKPNVRINVTDITDSLSVSFNSVDRASVDTKIDAIIRKTTEKYKSIPQRIVDTKAYIFNIKRAGSNGKTRYSENEIDLFALVCLDTMKIGYVKNIDMPDTINIRVDSERGNYHDEKGVKDYEMCLKEYKTDKNKSNIARKLNLATAVVSRYLQPKYKPFKTGARYFSDFIREPSWFLKL